MDIIVHGAVTIWTCVAFTLNTIAAVLCAPSRIVRQSVQFGNDMSCALGTSVGAMAGVIEQSCGLIRDGLCTVYAVTAHVLSAMVHWVQLVITSPVHCATFANDLLLKRTPRQAYYGLAILFALVYLTSTRQAKNVTRRFCIRLLHLTSVCADSAYHRLLRFTRWLLVIGRHAALMVVSPVLLVHVAFVRFGVYTTVYDQLCNMAVIGAPVRALAGWLAVRADDGDSSSDPQLACSVCLLANKSIMCRPCRHVCMCAQCASTLRQVQALRSRPACPMCRRDVVEFVNVYL